MKIFLLVSVSIPFFVTAQQTKKITAYHDNPAYSEVYYVLTSDNSTKQGSYIKYGHKNKIYESGFYKNNLKDSIWKTYQWGGKEKESAGYYSNDVREGIWEFYDFKGKLEQKYDYTKKELTFVKLDDKGQIKEYRVINGKDTTRIKLSLPPQYIGGTRPLNKMLSINISYPQEAVENGIKGEVLISFIVDSSGKISNHKIAKGIGYGCDEESLRVVKLFK